MSDADETRRQLRISCADALALMTEHLEGALSDRDAERMRDHLAGCRPCGVYLDQLRSTIKVSGELGAGAEREVAPERVDELTELFRRHQGADD